jgi:hypothetical protein
MKGRKPQTKRSFQTYTHLHWHVICLANHASLVYAPARRDAPVCSGGSGVFREREKLPEFHPVK